MLATAHRLVETFPPASLAPQAEGLPNCSRRSQRSGDLRIANPKIPARPWRGRRPLTSLRGCTDSIALCSLAPCEPHLCSNRSLPTFFGAPEERYQPERPPLCRPAGVPAGAQMPISESSLQRYRSSGAERRPSLARLGGEFQIKVVAAHSLRRFVTHFHLSATVSGKNGSDNIAPTRLANLSILSTAARQ